MPERETTPMLPTLWMCAGMMPILQPIPGAPGVMLPGQFGRVRLIGSAPYEALLLPDTAIATDQARKIVFVVKDDDTVEARAVTLGPLDDDLRVIREGLKPEDRVIVEGLQKVQPGMPVKPVEASATSGIAAAASTPSPGAASAGAAPAAR